MSRLRVVLLVLLIFAIGVFLRTYRLAELPPGLYPDEAMNGNNALEAIATGNYKLYYPENNGREALFINIQAQLLRVLVPLNNGLPEPWMLRLVSTIFGSLTVLGMYFLGRELVSKRIGLIASFLLATSFWHILFSRIGFRAIMAPFFLVWALYFFLVAVNKAKKNFQFSIFNFQTGGLAFIGGICFGLGFHSYIAYRVMPLLFLAAIPFFQKTPNFWKVAGVFVFATFIAAAPIGWYYLQNPADFLGRTSQVSVFSSPTPLKDLGLNIVKTLGMFNFVGDFNQRHNLSGSPQLFWPVGILFLIGIVLALKKFWKHFGRVAALVWFGLAMLPVIISNEGLPHALRAILMIPPTILFAAVGASSLYDWAAQRLRNPQFMSALIAFASVMLIAQAYKQYFAAWANHPDTPGAFAANYVDVGRAIRELPPGTPVYVHVDAGGVLVRGIPMPSQTVMFLTDTFTSDKQNAKNIHYVVPGDGTVIPPNAFEYYVR